MTIRVTLLAGILFCMSGTAVADVAGGEDHPDIGRYQGSEILHYAVEDFGSTVFATGPVQAESDIESTSMTVEGGITRIVYQVPKGVSALEVFRNFETRAADSNYEVAFSGGPAEIKDYVFKYRHPVEVLREAEIGNGIHYFLAKKEVAGDSNWLSVLVAPHGGGQGIRVGLISATSKAMAQQMVDASQMARSLHETGRVALYGIYFEHDSAKLTRESKPTLDEIAVYMKENSDQKIIVVGHTDYVGGYDYNIDLSKRRAGAVADALVADYGIDAARLKSDGVGYLAPAATNLSDTGRALNRRVELVQDK